MKKFLIITVILLTLLAALAGLLIGVATRFALLEVFLSLAPVNSVISETNVLVLGVDNVFGHRSDTIMVAHVNPAKKEVAVVSIPRDTIVIIPDRGLDKINHAFAYGGVELSRKTIEGFLHLDIPYYVTVNLAGIEKLIDDLGGIEINVEKRMYYMDYAGDLYINLQPGRQKLNGKQAMGYLRFRHTDNDFARIHRQQDFLKTLVAELMKRENLLRSPGLFLSLLGCIETNLNSREILGLALSVRGAFELGQVEMNMIPGSDLMVDGIYYWRPNEAETQKIIGQFFLGKKLALSESGR